MRKLTVRKKLPVSDFLDALGVYSALIGISTPHISTLSHLRCELRKGKVFVFSNKQDGLWQFVRVNKTEKHMRDQEVQVFDLVDGENNVYAFGRIFGDEVNNCTGIGYSFNTKDFPEYETHFFVIAEPAEREFAGRYFNCYKEVHFTEEGFFYVKENPRSRVNLDWVLNR